MATSGALRRIDPKLYPDAPLKATLFAEVAASHLNPEGFLAILRKDPAAVGKGRHIANLAEAPSFNETDTRQNPFEDVYGQSGDVVGNEQIESTRAEITCQPISLTLDNYKLIRPDFNIEEIMGADAVRASTTSGAGASAVHVEADEPGEVGNDVRYGVVVGGLNTPLSVAVDQSGVTDDITVHAATDGAGAPTSTAAQVRDAINAHLTASVLVTASLPEGSDGTGVVAASALAALTGGVDGTPIGVKLTRRGHIAPEDHLSNFVLVYSTSDRVIAGAHILRKAINVNEEREHSFDGDGNVFGVEITLRAHMDGDTLDLETGALLPAFEERIFGRFLPAA